MRIAVVGAGISGLVAAYRLRKALGPKLELVLLERSERIGGILRTDDIAGEPVDLGAEAFVGRRPEIPALLGELGLADQLVYPAGKRPLIWSGAAAHPLPERTLMGIPAGPDALAGLVDEATLAWIADEPARPLDWVPGGDMAVGELVAARLGEQVVRRSVDPLLGGVYAGLANSIGVRAALPTLAAALDAGAASLSQAVADALPPPSTAPVFGGIRDGYRVLLEALLKAAAPRLETGCAPAQLTRTAHGWRLDLVDEQGTAGKLGTAGKVGTAAELGPAGQVGAAGERGPAGQVGAAGERGATRQRGAAGELNTVGELGMVGELDAVVLATPAPVTASLLRGVAPAAAAAMVGIELSSSAVVALALPPDTPLPDNSGILVATGEPLRAKAFTLSSRKWPHLAARDVALVRASFGRFGDDSLLSWSDDDLIAAAATDLSTVTGIPITPITARVQRWHGGLPQYAPGHLDRVAAIEAGLADLPGLAIAGAYLHGVGVPACAASGTAAAEAVLADLTRL
ncbi:FAD-dependent oxidoreductase [Nocardia wallacei]|uniref:Protoporphyrinogen oxidase n=1 Tax=Nocardia wallacei TaxID=480035 RepID=A0A7G1KLB0_9NOCA|nr:FAD-dependent oxidoreductase [Nocardia wallacei]BCK54769.1 protoporphyrinogen oxidase [Nocardia wallacei]